MCQHILKPVTGLVSSYLLGSIPTGYIIGRLYRNIDLRKYGSGNLGATNAFRVLGKGIGTSVLILDILKGTAAVLLAKSLFYNNGLGISSNLFISLCGFAAVAGHNWTIFLKFKGGKGVATTLGVLIGFSVLINNFIWLLLSLLFLWLFIFLLSGYVSLASVIASLVSPFLALFFHLSKEVFCLLLILAIFSLIRHNSNIYKLLQKKENRFNTSDFLKKIFKKTLP